MLMYVNFLPLSLLPFESMNQEVHFLLHCGLAQVFPYRTRICYHFECELLDKSHSGFILCQMLGWNREAQCMPPEIQELLV